MFRGYDIRGVFGSEVTPEKFQTLGRACNAFCKEIVCGFDYRKHSKPLFESFSKGFGGKIFSLGHAPTAAIAFNSSEYGMAFTASHNPSEYAGAKFIVQRHTAFEEHLQKLKGEFEKTVAEKNGLKSASVTQASDLLENYLQAIPAIENGLYDLAGGAACAVKQIFPKKIFAEPDPLFERHSPEPTDETLDALKRETKKIHSLGFAFDGDADRCIVADEGRVIEGGATTAFLCEREFKKSDSIVITIDFTDEVKNHLHDAGLNVFVCPIGTKNVVTALAERKALFGAEHNGHYYFPAHLPDSDGIYAAALLSQARPGEVLEFSKRFKHVLLADAVKHKADFTKLRKMIEHDDAVLEYDFMDGIYARFDDFTLLIRASQTEPKVRVNSEAETRELAEKGMEKAKKILRDYTAPTK